MYKKSSVFKRKYQSASKTNFFLFAYLPIAKAERQSKIVREIGLKNLSMLNLPSYYNLVKEQKVQNPRVVLIYAKTLNIKQIQYLNTLDTTCFKLDNNWYSSVLLKESSKYKTSLNICKAFVNNIIQLHTKLLFSFFYSLSLKSKLEFSPI
jgi:hypothetical protein